MKRRDYLPILAISFLLIGLATAVTFVQRQTQFRSKAAPDTVLSLSAPSQITIGTEFTANILINTGTNSVSAAEIWINFPTDKLEALSISTPTDPFLPVVLSTGSIDNTAGITSIILGVNPWEPKQGAGILAQIVFKGITEANPAIISFDTRTKVAAINETNSVVSSTNPHSIIIGSIITPTPSPTSTPSITATPTPYFEPIPSGSVTQYPTPITGTCSCTKDGKITKNNCPINYIPYCYIGRCSCVRDEVF